MRFSAEKSTPRCGCRSVEECSRQFHGFGADGDARDSLVKAFSEEMRKKLDKKARLPELRSGWDDPEWTVEQIKAALIRHIDKGDPVDVANFAAFWWNRTDEGEGGESGR